MGQAGARRVLRQVWRGHSLARAFMNAQLERLGPLSGLVLDVGSGAHPSYWPLLKLAPDARLITLDVNSLHRPSVVADVERGVPFRDGSIGTILLLNVLEHIFTPRGVIAELARVLSPGGYLYMATPFLVGVHTARSDGAFVDDFFRYTHSTYNRLLREEQRFDDVRVSRCGGLFTAVAALLQPALKFRLLWFSSVCVAAALDQIVDRRFPMNRDTWVVGYFVQARRGAG